LKERFQYFIKDDYKKEFKIMKDPHKLT